MATHLKLRSAGISFLVCSACTADTSGLLEVSDVDAGSSLDAALPGACSGPNPAGCVVNGCPPDSVCDRNLGCESSSCVCSEGGWSCDDDCSGGQCRPLELIFRLRYASDVPTEQIFVQNHLGAGQQWVRIFDARNNPLPVLSDCGICPCDRCNSCVICDGPSALARPVSSGEMVEWRWDLRVHPIDRCAAGTSATASCQLDVPATPGDYLARFCWGYRTTPDRIVEEPRCEDVPFTWPTTETVIEHSICDCG